MSEPTPEELLAAFNAGVQHHIDTLAALGETISWDDAVIQFGNFLTNYANDPEGVKKILSMASRLEEVELLMGYVLDKIGREVVGPGPVDPGDPIPPPEPR